MAKGVNAGVVLVDAGALRHLLGLDDKHEVLTVYQGAGRRGCLAFMVIGPLMPEREEGQEAPFVWLHMEQRADGKVRAVRAERMPDEILESAGAL